MGFTQSEWRNDRSINVSRCFSFTHVCIKCWLMVCCYKTWDFSTKLTSPNCRVGVGVSFRVRVFVFCVRLCHLHRAQKKLKQQESERLETGRGMTGWMWLWGGMAGRVCGAALSQYCIPVCELGQERCSYGPKGLSKEDAVRTSTRPSSQDKTRGWVTFTHPALRPSIESPKSNATRWLLNKVLEFKCTLQI